MKPEEKQLLMQKEEELRKDWNRSVFAHIKKLKAIKVPNIEDSVGVSRACQEYIDICEADGMKPSIAGLASALGTNRNTLIKWVRGEISIQTADIILECFSLIEIFDETALKDNKTNAVAGLFNMKNNYGYKDEVEIKHVEEKKPSNAEIAMKYGKRAEIVDVQPHEIDYTQPEEKKPVEVKEADNPPDSEDDIPF